MRTAEGHRKKVWRFVPARKPEAGNLLSCKPGVGGPMHPLTTITVQDFNVFTAPYHGYELFWDQIELPEHKRKQLADAEWVAERMRFAAVTLRDLIEVDPEKCGGVPVLKGSRITIARLIAELAEDRNVSQLAAAFRLDKDTIVQML